MLAYRMHLPETVVGLRSTKIKGNSRMKDGMPFGYWESCDARYGGVIMDIKENGLCVRSLVDMHIGAELRIRIFFSLGNEFCRFQVLARTIGKELCCGEGWKAYEYELEFVEMSEQDRLGIRQTGNIYSWYTKEWRTTQRFVLRLQSRIKSDWGRPELDGVRTFAAIWKGRSQINPAYRISSSNLRSDVFPVPDLKFPKDIPVNGLFDPALPLPTQSCFMNIFHEGFQMLTKLEISATPRSAVSKFALPTSFFHTGVASIECTRL